MQPHEVDEALTAAGNQIAADLREFLADLGWTPHVGEPVFVREIENGRLSIHLHTINGELTLAYTVVLTRLPEHIMISQPSGV